MTIFILNILNGIYIKLEGNICGETIFQYGIICFVKKKCQLSLLLNNIKSLVILIFFIYLYLKKQINLIEVIVI